MPEAADLPSSIGRETPAHLQRELPPAPIAIHVLSGDHRGAVLDIDEGPTLLGSASHCDVVLSETTVAEEHALLLRNGGSLKLRVLAERTMLAASSEAAFASALNGDVIQLKRGSRLCCGDVEICFDESSATPVATGKPTAGPDDLASDPDIDLQPAAAAFAQSDLAGLSANADRPMHAVPGWMNGPVSRTLGLALAVALGVTLLSQFLTVGQATSAVITEEQAHASLRTLIESIGEPELVVIANPGEVPRIGGYVRDLSALQRIRNALADQPVRISVFAADELTRFARDLIASRGISAEVRYAGHGALTIEGSDDSHGTLAASIERIRQELPGLAHVNARITHADPDPVSKPDDPFVLSGINGVNAGHDVPFISAGDSYIFKGGVLRNGMKVIDIEPARVIVNDRENKRHSEVLVQ